MSASGQKQTRAVRKLMSAWGQKRPHTRRPDADRHHLCILAPAKINHCRIAANHRSLSKFGFMILKSLSTTNKLPA